MKPIIDWKWTRWFFGFSFHRGLYITYACKQTEGEPSQLSIFIGPLELFWAGRSFMKYECRNERYSDCNF